jgi:segregation and condensation protein B
LAQAARPIDLFESRDDVAAREAALREAALREAARVAEALLFAASEPLDEAEIARRLPSGTDVQAVLARLREEYSERGVHLTRAGRKWFFRTAADLGWVLAREPVEQKKLSRAALETLAIVAYHQPVTRAEIEDIRGVAVAKGTLDVLLDTGWIRLRGRRRAPGRPITYGTTEGFLMHFGLEQIGDLPGLEELKGAGLFDGRLPKGFGVPQPSDDSALKEDEEPLETEQANALELEYLDEPESPDAPEELVEE